MVHRWFNPRCQLPDCLGYGLTEVVQFLSVHPAPEGSTDVGAGQPEFDVIHLVYHRILDMFQSATINADQGEPYSDHSKNDADRSADGLGWRNAQDFLREVQALDGQI